MVDTMRGPPRPRPKPEPRPGSTKKYKCEKHIGCVVIHENCDRQCPICIQIEDLIEANTEIMRLHEAAVNDYEDADFDLNELRKEYDKLEVKFKIIKG